MERSERERGRVGKEEKEKRRRMAGKNVKGKGRNRGIGKRNRGGERRREGKGWEVREIAPTLIFIKVGAHGILCCYISLWTYLLTYLPVLQIYPIIAALFAMNSAPAFALFKFMQVG